jgi:hypothetical protein
LLAANGFRIEVFEAIDELSDRAKVRRCGEDNVRYRVMKRFPIVDYNGRP